MNWNMTVVEVVSQKIEHLPSTRIRKFDIQSNRDRREPVNKVEHFEVIRCNNSFQIVFMSLVDENFRESQIIFNDQDSFIISRQMTAVVAGFIDHLVHYLETS